MIDFEMIDDNGSGTRIKVVGVGGAGGNAVRHMVNKGVSGVEFIAANTDKQALSRSKAQNLIQLGSTGQGAGANPAVARQLAEESRTRIEDALRGADMVFIAAGMGKGTGTGATPVIAEVAKSLGALTVAVVSRPFSYEGTRCMKVAESGLEELERHVDSLIVIQNEKLETLYEDSSFQEWLELADDVLKNAVAGIAEIINVAGHINVDFSDVKTIMAEQGKALMGTAVAEGMDRARLAAEQAINSPLLDGIELSNARGILLNITASSSLSGKEIKEITKTVRDVASEDALIISGIVYDDNMGDEVRVTVVATGLGRRLEPPRLVKQALFNTGTHDASGFMEVPTIIRSPKVWQTGHSSAETLLKLSGTDVNQEEIPAFLRKQAD
jgi:cell division protein FtsZ